MSDVILVCEGCGDRRSITEVQLGEICKACHMDGYRLGYGVYFYKPIQLPNQPRSDSPVEGKSQQNVTQ